MSFISSTPNGVYLEGDISDDSGQRTGATYPNRRETDVGGSLEELRCLALQGQMTRI
jgi:hypothetical protein